MALANHNREAQPRLRRKLIAGVSALAMTVLAGAATLPPVHAQGQSQTQAAAQVQSEFDRSYAPLVEKILPAVVNVSVERTEQAQVAQLPPQLNDPELQRFFERFFGDRLPQQQPREFRARGEGSGFIIDTQGYVVTNAHVVGNADKVTISMQDGTKYPGELVGVDEKTDLAVVKIKADKPLPFVEFGDSKSVKVGDKVLAVGNPFGLGGTVTSGIVSATGRELGAGPYDDFLQIDAPINPGNSGGPTFDLNGKVIGVNSMIFSPSGGSVGIGFTISSNLAKDVVAELIRTGTIKRGWLGVAIQEIDEDIGRSLGLPGTEGALVSKVEPGSPAAEAGVRPGDVIQEFNGTRIDRLRSLSRAVAATDPGKPAKVTVWRDGQKKTLDVTIAQMPGSQQVAAAERGEGPAANTPRLGLSLAPIDPGTRQQLGLEASQKGVLVQQVAPNSPAGAKGIRPGDVLLQVAGKPVGTPREVQEAVRSAHGHGDKSVLVLVMREGEQRFVAIPLAVS